jgi:acyl-CoA thioester hydrolase
VRLAIEPTLDPADYAFAHDIRVRFAETDAMGVVHHAAYLPYLEEARVEYLRAVGHPYTKLQEEGLNAAVLEAFVSYRRPLRFDDLARVHVRLARMTAATFQVAYLVTVDGEASATAVTVHGCVTATGRPARVPKWLRALSDPARSGVDGSGHQGGEGLPGGDGQGSRA